MRHLFLYSGKYSPSTRAVRKTIVCAAPHGDGLPRRLAADGHPRHQAGHSQLHDVPPPRLVQISAMICPAMTAEAAPEIMPQISPTTSLQNEATLSALRSSQMALPASGDLLRRHGVKRLFICRCHRHADHIKQNAQRDDKKQQQKRRQHPAVFQQHAGDKRKRRRDADCHQDDRHAPSPALGLLFFDFFSRLAGCASKSRSSLCSCNSCACFKFQKNVAADKIKPCVLGRVGFPQRNPPVAGTGGFPFMPPSARRRSRDPIAT